MRTNMSYDPKLKAAMLKIKEIARDYDVFIACELVSPTHSEEFLQWPTWSGAQFEGENRIRIKMSGKDQNAWNHTAHIIASTARWLDKIRIGFDALLDQLRKKAIIGLPNSEITPHSPEMEVPL